MKCPVIIPLEEEIVSTTALVWLKSISLSPACRLFDNFLSVKMPVGASAFWNPAMRKPVESIARARP